MQRRLGRCRPINRLDARIAPWLARQSLLIALITIAFAFVGDGLRDALDPQTNIRR